MYYINDNVRDLNRIFDQNSREGYLRLDLNENPSGLPEKFVKEVLAEVTPEFVAQYPETFEFTRVLAEFLGTDIENICLTNGSAEGIRYIIEAYTSPGGKILGVTPSYAMYEVYSKMYGRQYIPVHYDAELEIDVDKIMEKMTNDIELLIILNPNNPMGNAYSHKDIEKIIDKARENEITVLIDEAYFYFYPVSFMKYAIENENVFLTRTFSKLFSLGGARLGYVVGRKYGISMIQKLCTPHNVNAFGMKFAKAIIEKDGMIQSLTDIALEGKEFLIDELTKEGYSVNAKEGNFIFLKPNKDAEHIKHELKEKKGILVKSYNDIGSMGNCLRITIGNKKIMKQFMEALVELDK